MQARKIGAIVAVVFFGLLTVPAIPTAAQEATPTNAKPTREVSEPPPDLPLKLNVAIPGFAPKAVSSGLFAQYVVAVYRLGISIVAVVSTIAFIYGAFLYLVGSAAGQVSKGKQVMFDAVIGLLLVIGAVTILRTVNPAVTRLTLPGVSAIRTEEWDFMEAEGGYSNQDLEAQIKAHAEAGRTPPGLAAIIHGTDLGDRGELVDTAVQEQGQKPAQRLASYCTKPEDAKRLDSYEDKIAALVRAVAGFHKICIQENGCAYVRTGFTNLATGAVASGVKEYPFLQSWYNAKASTLPVPSECSALWSSFSAAERNDFIRTSYSKEKLSIFEWFYPGGRCYNILNDLYKTQFTERLSELGIFGGDCGSTLSAMYACAGGSVAAPFSGDSTNLYYYINTIQFPGYNPNNPTRKPSEQFIVWRANDLNDFLKQVEAAGGLKFGDIFVTGQRVNHNFMYTGGRDEIPFEIFEMGGGGSNDGTTGSQVQYTTPDGATKIVGGARVHTQGKLLKYIVDTGHRVWPITVSRPYDFRPCDTKADCERGEACHCTQRSQGAAYKPNCTMKNICHQPVSIQYLFGKRGLICSVDEESCPNGWTCTKRYSRCEAAR